ncbi:MAG: macro domain-containing protein [Chloroflexota bacterium]|nr:MAG: macro domain-containing protein [Chloroflexota bacterium]
MNQLINEHILESGQHLQLVQGDLTQEEVDAIVNAANANLQHGAGVAGAISRRGGSKIQEESDAWLKKNGPVRHEKPAYTSGGRLPCRFVIHAVGPVWGEGDEDAKLEKAISGALEMADELGIKSIAFPAISTGVFGFPKPRASRIIFSVFENYFIEHPDSRIETVRMTLFDDESIVAFAKEFKQMFELQEN